MKNSQEKLSRPRLRIFLSLLIVLGVVIFWVLRPIRNTDFATPGFTPLRDAALARKYVPRLIPHSLYGGPTHIYYRMARAMNGDLHIAYHPFFPNEENPHSGVGPLLSRNLYTGGLNLKTFMYGPADVELIEVFVNPNGAVNAVVYETARNYRPSAFGVEHSPQTIANPPLPLCFTVMTWNHMFSAEKPEKCTSSAATPLEYFSERQWIELRMVKNTEAILRRNRAHRVYERQAVN